MAMTPEEVTAELKNLRAQQIEMIHQMWQMRVARQAEIIWELRARLAENGLPPSTGRDFCFDYASDIEILYPTQKETSNE